MSVKTIDELLLDELKDIYSAEKQAIKAYPKLIKAVESEDLKEAMQEHLQQTQQQLDRLERIFERLEERPGGKTCNGMKGLLEEAFEHIDEIESGPVLDAALIGALQRVEHYEIAAYGTARAFAQATGESEIQKLLATTLDEEKETDEKLTGVAESVNADAISGSEDSEDDESDVDADDEGDEEGLDEDADDVQTEDEGARTSMKAAPRRPPQKKAAKSSVRKAG